MTTEMAFDGMIKHCNLASGHAIDVKRAFGERTLKRIPRIVDSAEKLLHLHDPKKGD